MSVKYLVSGKGGTHLPYTDAAGKPDHRLMGAAWASLHGGYRGNKYEGPNKVEAISKLASMYKREQMETPSEAWCNCLAMKEADILATMGDSYNAIRNDVDAAITKNIRDGVDMDCDDDGPEDVNEWCYIQDLFPTMVVYTMNSELFMCAWHRLADGSIFLGTPFPVSLAYTTKDTPYPEETDSEESQRILTTEVTQFLNESYDSTKGTLTVKVIQPGFNKSGARFYPKETLVRDHKIFEGNKMFADHQTDQEDKVRPEGSVNNWVASLVKVWPEADGTLMGEAQVIDPAFKSKLKTLSESGLLQDMGVSIRAVGRSTSREIDGRQTMYVESLLHARSVDFVTYAGAGGQVMAIESAVSSDEHDADLMTESAFRQRRPDLVSVIETKVKENAMKTQEELLKEKDVQIAALTTQINESNVKVATAELSRLLSESKLPEVAVTRLKKQFEGAVKTEGMSEAITAEVEYIKSLQPTPVVADKKNGAAHNGTEVSESAKPDLKKGFMKLGLTKEQAEIAAGV